ncbi:MAG: hypothetical protein O2805_05845 [Proteobacteria bacterium]|nr:hypothetical protein [Pseudomonadota bacterium]
MELPLKLRDGIDNLLFNCIGAKAGESLAIVSEQGVGGYYSATLDRVVAARARARSLDVHLVVAPVLEEVNTFPDEIRQVIESTDHVLFLSRIGDQVRFSELGRIGSTTMCYALDEESFATPFCSAHYEFFVRLKNMVNAAVFGEKEITIRCASGTYLHGISAGDPGDDDTVGDVTVKRFPMTVFRPIPANTFSGKIALTRWLVRTGTRIYEPESVLIDGVVFALVENGRIVDFDGASGEVEKIRAHYAFVANKFNIQADLIHSWHAGIHPQNGYFGTATDNLTRWAGSAFGNPRYLHLHTCGDYPPGEICISVFDPTVSVDGVDLWRDGRFVFAESTAVKTLQYEYPGMQQLFENPVMEYGLD